MQYVNGFSVFFVQDSRVYAWLKKHNAYEIWRSILLREAKMSLLSRTTGYFKIGKR